MDADRHCDSQEHHHDRQQVHGQPPVLERMEKARTHLEAYREYEQDQAEILHEIHHGSIHPHSEVTHYDGDEEYPGGTDSDAFDFQAAEIKAEGDYCCEYEDGMGNAGTNEKIFHSNY